MCPHVSRYCRRPFEVSAVNDDRNILVLRKDIHHLFDARRFTFVPKRFGPSPRPPEIVTHVLLPSGSPELVGLYHNRAPQPICGISVEFLFARFAWSLFTDEHIPFFGSDLDYAVRLLDKAKGEAETQSLAGPDVKNRAQLFASTPSQSRSVSPKKRSHSAYGDEAEDVTDNEYDDDDDDDDGGDEPPRGRPRKRRWQTFGADGAQVPSLSHSFASITLPSRAGSPGGGRLAASHAGSAYSRRDAWAPEVSKAHLQQTAGQLSLVGRLNFGLHRGNGTGRPR